MASLHRAAFLALFAALAAPTTGAAETVRPMMQVGAFRNSTGGDLGAQLGSSWGWRIDPGLQLGSVGLSLPLEMGGMNSHYPDRDNDKLLTMGFGLALKGHLYQGPHLGLVASAGYMQRFLMGGKEVLRTCSQTGTCDGGYWSETPQYAMGGPWAGLITTWTWPAGRDLRVGMALDTRLERPKVVLPGEGTVQGTMLSTSLTFWLSGDRR